MFGRNRAVLMSPLPACVSELQQVHAPPGGALWLPRPSFRAGHVWCRNFPFFIDSAISASGSEVVLEREIAA